MDIRGKNILLLGGSGLVGLAIARDLLPHSPARVVIAALRRDEATDGADELSGHPDADGVDTDVASVRAERSGTRRAPGDGRVYHISFDAEDGQDGTCSGTVQVCVPHDGRPDGACVDQGPLFDSTSCD